MIGGVVRNDCPFQFNELDREKPDTTNNLCQ